jgi:hypothetical protein
LFFFATSGIAIATFSSAASSTTAHGNRDTKASGWNSASNLTNHALGRLTLQPNSAGTRQGCKEQSFPSGKDVGEALDHLDV